jgi:hypothetical protein
VNAKDESSRSALLRITKPRCVLVYALAPDALPAAEANRQFNDFIADRRLPLVVYHDHFIGRPGGLALFYAETVAEREALVRAEGLTGWEVQLHPLIFSHSPAAFDEQIAFTLRAYRGQDWEALQKERRPAYGNPAREADTAEEE